MNAKNLKMTLACVLSIASAHSFALSTGDLLAVDNGSWWAWDFTDDGAIEEFEKTPLFAGTANGLVLSSTSLPGEMTAASSYLGLDSYLYFPDVPPSILSSDMAGNFEMDFSGFKWDFNVITVSLAGNSSFGDTGVAALSCSSSACASGDTYVLTYSAHNADPTNGYGELLFSMELTGTISTVPVPATIWLLGSGFLGLLGISRRKKAA